ncbi:insulinase family protein [Candidatus Berkiella aquae]|uniref:Insulinase family protein n=2 Tax=Candidatus Berkiella aquae TaxID=295108 RepID=A0AAE3HTH6_9GAMM|nr:insulinase family protein [Candidatus Berkiella aquae]
MKSASLIFGVILTWSLQSVATEKPITKEHQLQNGLKILVREDHRAPVVVSQIWYKVGSSDEYRGITGISHALEHMMFQGTPTLPGDGFAQLISEYGGQNNAFTGDDYTAYYEELDASHLDISFKSEADRMTNLLIAPEAFAKEIKVVMEERRMRTDDNPQNLTWERFMAIANVMGPYHHPVIGWQDDLDHMSAQDLKAWYQQWYTPSNATIVVVGDVEADKVFSLADKYFGKIPARPAPKTKTKNELTALGEKRIKVHLPAKLPYAIWGFDAPSIKTAKDEKEVYALLVASAILDGGESSRFSRFLVRGEQVAAALNTNYDIFKQYGSQFIITGVPTQGHTIAELEGKVLAQLEKLQNEPVSLEELQKVKTQILAQEIFEKDSMSQQATFLGLLETVGLPWQLADQFTEKVKAVTVHDVQAAAKKYFNVQNITVAELIPEKEMVN